MPAAAAEEHDVDHEFEVRAGLDEPVGLDPLEGVIGAAHYVPQAERAQVGTQRVGHGASWLVRPDPVTGSLRTDGVKRHRTWCRSQISRAPLIRAGRLR